MTPQDNPLTSDSHGGLEAPPHGRRAELLCPLLAVLAGTLWATGISLAFPDTLRDHRLGELWAGDVDAILWYGEWTALRWPSAVLAAWGALALVGAFSRRGRPAPRASARRRLHPVAGFALGGFFPIHIAANVPWYVEVYGWRTSDDPESWIAVVDMGFCLLLGVAVLTKAARSYRAIGG